MTDRTQPDSASTTGSTHIIRYALELGLLWIDGDGRDKVREALDALDTLEAQLEAVGAGGVQPLRKCLHHIEEPLEKVLERREAVIQILERDAHEAHQRAAHALGTRKVLWNLLGECSPLLHQLECNDHESEEQLNSLLRRIDDARAVVQAEELPNARP